MNTKQVPVARHEKKKIIAVRVTESEHAEITEAVGHLGNPSRVAKILLTAYSAARKDQGVSTVWPPEFVNHEGRSTFENRSAPGGGDHELRDLCTTSIPCAHCRASNGVHRFGGLCPLQDELVITPAGTVLYTTKSSSRFLGANLYATRPGYFGSFEEEILRAAASGEAIYDAAFNIPSLWHVAPVFDQHSAEPAGYRVTLAPAYN